MNEKQLRKTAKALLTFENILNEEQEKLYDRMHSIKLSHNRKWKLLKAIQNKCKQIDETYNDKTLHLELLPIIEKIENELTFVGKKNWGLK